jgi:hypothetical protein
MFAVSKPALCIALLVTLTACNDAKPPVEKPTQPKNTVQVASEPLVLEETAPVLAYLDAKPQAAQFVLPQCKRKDCPKLELQALVTQDAWLNTWLSTRQAKVLMQQISKDANNFSLQQAVNRYVDASNEWQRQHRHNQVFQLQLASEIVYQKNGIVLLQIQVNSHQAETKIQDRLYFFVADRHTQKNLNVTDIIHTPYAATLQDIVDQAYQKWLNEQEGEVKIAAPEKIKWQQGEWFYDQYGIGLHFRAGYMSPTAKQLDIYLSPAQTKQVLQPELYQRLFNPKSMLEEDHEAKNRAA